MRTAERCGQEAGFSGSTAEGGHPLNIVAITDGAKDIHLRLREIFGFQVTLILDWYHLCK
ncbi:hypothetical protein DENIS_2681 [Desulfonema ishimotonii]|uniref:Transposase n=1 Tax=Desulfonema ishimotonii TaxID=45657 RepID=A0A401FXP9_9BACT|nr:hypothetical protein DENIS_2681 [Desulfonema ishimotonii]